MVPRNSIRMRTLVLPCISYCVYHNPVCVGCFHACLLRFLFFAVFSAVYTCARLPCLSVALVPMRCVVSISCVCVRCAHGNTKCCKSADEARAEGMERSGTGRLHHRKRRRAGKHGEVLEVSQIVPWWGGEGGGE